MIPSMHRLPSCRSLLVLPSLVLLLMVAPRPAAAVELFFNSYGWSKVYRLHAASATGSTTLLPPADLLNTTFLSATDAGPDDKIYGAISSDLWRIDVSSPTAVWQKVLTMDNPGYAGLTWSPLGELYVLNSTALRRVNPATGATIGGTTVTVKNGASSLFLQGMDFSPQGILYGADSTHLYTINPGTGAATLIFTLPPSGADIFLDIDFGSDGILRVLGYLSDIFSYNPQNGTGSWSSWKLSYDGSSFSPSALASVPEPGSLLLAAMGLVGRFVLGVRRGTRAILQTRAS